MKSIFRSLKKEDIGELMLGILILIFIIMGYKVPEPFDTIINSLFGKIAMFVLAIYIFMNANPLLAILLLFAIFNMSMSNNINSMGSNALQKYAPSEVSKASQFTAFNQFPYTLEQEIVKKMAPIIKPGISMTKPSYKPVLEETYYASPVTNAN